MKVFGQLERAQLEALSGDPTGLGLITGRVWNNTTTSDLKYYNGSVRIFANLDEIQTFTNKVLSGNTIANFTPDGVNTLTAPVGVNDTLALLATAQTLENKSFPTSLLPHQVTPAAPAVGNILIYSKNDNKLYKQDSEGNEVEVGTGGAGIDVFHVEDFEVNNAADMSSGNNATFLGGGVLAGTLADNTATQIAGSRSLQYTQAAGSLNDYIATPSFDIDRKEAGNASGLSLYFTYTGNKDDIKVVAYDATNNEVISSDLDLIASASNPTRFLSTVNVPTGVTSLRLGVQVVVENIGAILVIDEIQLSSDPFKYKELYQEHNISYSGRISRDGSNYVQFRDEEKNNNGELISVANSTQTRFTFLKDCTFSASTSYAGSNGSEVALRLFNQAGTLIYETRDASASNGVVAVPMDHEAQAGDYLLVNSSLNPNDQLQSNFSVNAKRKTDHVVTPMEAGSQLIRYDGFDSKTVSNFLKYSTRRYNKDSNGNDTSPLFTDDNTGTFTLITATERCNMIITAGGEHSAANTVKIDRYNSSDVLQESNKNEQNTGFNSATVSMLVQMNVGDYIKVFYDQPTIVTDAETFWLQVLATPTRATALGLIPEEQIAHIKDVKSSSTQGGTSSAASWQTRDLNTVEGDSFLSLAANEFTLPKGKYDTSAMAPSYDSRRSKLRLYNVTTASTQILGDSAYGGATGGDDQSKAEFSGSFTLTEQNTFRIEHYTELGVATNGLGVSSNIGGVDEIYTTVKIRKIK